MLVLFRSRREKTLCLISNRTRFHSYFLFVKENRYVKMEYFFPWKAYEDMFINNRGGSKISSLRREA